MECFFPGRIIVGPEPGTEKTGHLAERIVEEFHGDFEFDFSIEDVLRANDLEVSYLHSQRPLPFVGRVPEGAEQELSARIVRLTGVGAAIPDYLTYPDAPIIFNEIAIQQAIQLARIEAGSHHCGDGCLIGVLDSGIDPTDVSNAKMHPRSYNAVDPLSTGLTSGDSTGHGSLIARIISEIAPGAELVPIKIFERNGTISSVIAGLYLAERAGPCDVVNLSLSVSCAPVPCSVCRAPTPAAMNIKQINFFFENYMRAVPSTVLVAAAGNNTSHVALPAALENIIAVGSFDYEGNVPVSKYQQVPMDRFVLAPGGLNSSTSSFAERTLAFRPEYLHGTSFAAAFVSGFIAKVICNMKSAYCASPLRGTPAGGHVYGTLAAVLGELEARSDRSWSGYDGSKHGLGSVYFY